MINYCEKYRKKFYEFYNCQSFSLSCTTSKGSVLCQANINRGRVVFL
jgi:hypothetical protein